MITKERVSDFKRYHANGERLSKEDQGSLLEYVTHIEDLLHLSERVIDELSKTLCENKIIPGAIVRNIKPAMKDPERDS